MVSFPFKSKSLFDSATEEKFLMDLISIPKTNSEFIISTHKKSFVEKLARAHSK